MRASYPAQIIARSLTSDGAKLKTKSERNPFETKRALFKTKIINTLFTTKRSCPGMIGMVHHFERKKETTM